MLFPVTLLIVIFTTLSDTSNWFDPFCFRRPNTTVHSDAIGGPEKQLALVSTKFSDTSVPPHTCWPFCCKLAIHGQSPADATEAPFKSEEPSGVCPQTTGLGLVGVRVVVGMGGVRVVVGLGGGVSVVVGLVDG